MNEQFSDLNFKLGAERFLLGLGSQFKFTDCEGQTEAVP